MAEQPGCPTSPLASIVERFRAAEVMPEPYPHYRLENVFPDEYYQALLRQLPGSSVYQSLFETSSLKLAHFRHRDQRDLNEGWTDALPDELRAFWNDFNEWFLGPELARAVLDSFAEPLGERFGPKKSWPAVSVEAQLIRHRAGYFLGPHTDLHTKLVVLLVYLAKDESAKHLGTSLYLPKDPGFSCPNSIHYPFQDFVRVKTVPFMPNSLLGFVRSDVSFHGVELLSEKDCTTCSRDVIQYVLYDKQAREAQLRARRSAAAKGAGE
jgi:hypothetical protein